ncbi:MAG: hypothetical protein IJL29_06575 [Prevotella sp.]|nr:hypothetical protein [Prevotella sp.]
MQQVRYNNPGNIMQHAGTPFYGEVKSPHRRLTAFKSIELGIRAVVKIIRTYQMKGFKTYRQIIYRYAPPSENATWRYLQFVCSRCASMPDDEVRPASERTLVAAICYYESHYVLTEAMWNRVIEIL